MWELNVNKGLHNHTRMRDELPKNNRRKTSLELTLALDRNLYEILYVALEDVHSQHVKANGHEGLMIMQPRYTKLSYYCGPQYLSTTHATSHNEN